MPRLLGNALRFAFLAGCLVAVPRDSTAQSSALLFPGQSGADLRAAIAETYAPVAALSLAESKDTLYAVIDRDTLGGQPGVAGLYTGFFAPFDCDPDCDPSQDVYNNGSGISQEHTWPRSMGAETGLAERDMHHTFPAKQTANAARGNLPFGESDDAATTAWYVEDQAQSNAPPVETRDSWSERQGSALFEPREAVKGDVARALFYFYAMYGPAGANQADTTFWAGMKEALLAWHRADPAAAAEVARSERVAHYQTTGSGAPAINPFVVDSSLAARAFFPAPEEPTLALTVLLQGAYVPASDAVEGAMRADLSAVLPETDPFFGRESVAAGYFTEDLTGPRVVDWVLVQLLSGTPGSTMAVEGERVGLLLRDGTVAGTDGGALSFPTPGTYHVAVRHRNHVAALSAEPVTLAAGQTATSDFSAGVDQAYGPNSQAAMADGRAALWAGDVTGDGQVTAPDFNAYSAATAAGATGYAPADLNLDGQVTAPDFNLFSVSTASGAAFSTW